MKKFFAYLSLFTSLFFGASNAKAQYYQIAEQIPDLLRPALSGAFNYKGIVEAHYLKGIGANNVDFAGISTSQGFKYGSWFFMGAGLGVEGAFSHLSDNFAFADSPIYGQTYSTSAVMIPIFTDFRFNIGSQTSTSFFAGIKLGCSFLASTNNLKVNNGYMTSQQYFMLRPSMGVRIPLQTSNNNNGKQAFNIGITYQLLTSNYWYNYYSNISVNSLGLDVSFEW